MSADKFPADAADLSARNLVAITPSDDSPLANVVKALYVGVTGTLKVTAVGDADTAAVTFVGVPAGAILPVRAVKVWNTGTSAGNIVGLL